MAFCWYRSPVRLISAGLLAVMLAGCGVQTPPAPVTESHVDSTASWQQDYDAGMAFLDKQQYGKAIDAFSSAIEADPMSADSFVQRGNAYYLAKMSGEYTAIAEADYNQALTLDPGCPGAWMGLADIELRQGHFDKAIETLETALEYTHQDPAVLDRLETFRAGNFADSHKNYHKVSYYSSKGDLLWYAVFNYTSSDSNGWKRQVTAYDFQDQKLSCVEEVYDMEGRPLVKVYEDQPDGIFWRKELAYDDAGRVLRESLFDHEGTPVSKSIFWYDENDLLVRQDDTDFRNSEKSHRTISYNRQNLAASRHYYDGEDMLTKIESYDYDDLGRCIGVSSLSPDDELLERFTVLYEDSVTTIRFYDSKGTLLRYRVSSPEGITWYTPDGKPQEALAFQ